MPQALFNIIQLLDTARFIYQRIHTAFNIQAVNLRFALTLIDFPAVLNQGINFPAPQRFAVLTQFYTVALSYFIRKINFSSVMRKAFDN